MSPRAGGGGKGGGGWVGRKGSGCLAYFWIDVYGLDLATLTPTV